VKAGVITAVIVGAACCVPAHAAAPKLAPPVACTSANRMDIFVDEDFIMYECQCQMLKSGNLCAWQVIGGVDRPEIRRPRKHKTHGIVAPVLSRVAA
jgi:hypothetical protein